MSGKPSEDARELMESPGHAVARIAPSDLTNKKFVDNLYINIKSDVIVITEDKARHCLRDSMEIMGKREAWQVPAGILATLVTVLLTATTHDALGIPAATWTAVEMIMTVFGFWWLIICLFKFRLTAKPTVDSVISQMKRLSAKEGVKNND
jgi:hypothetical protein